MQQHIRNRKLPWAYNTIQSQTYQGSPTTNMLTFIHLSLAYSILHDCLMWNYPYGSVLQHPHPFENKCTSFLSGWLLYLLETFTGKLDNVWAGILSCLKSFDNIGKVGWNNGMNSINRTLRDHIIDAARTSISRTKGNLPERPKSWWNENCHLGYKEQNKAWGTFRHLSSDNPKKVNKMKATANFVHQQSQRAIWGRHASTINSFTTPKKIWDKITRRNRNYRFFSNSSFIQRWCSATKHSWAG